MPAKARSTSVSVEDAADVLGIYAHEVAGVDGDVATTTDGQQYRLTGSARGDWEWLKADGTSVVAPAAEEPDADASE